MSAAVACGNGSKASTLDLPPEARGEAPGRGRMVGRRVLVVGAGMAALMRDVAYTGNERSIRANIVMLGGIDTGIERNHGRHHAPALPIYENMPMGRARHRVGDRLSHAVPALTGVRVHHRPGHSHRRRNHHNLSRQPAVAEAENPSPLRQHSRAGHRRFK